MTFISFCCCSKGRAKKDVGITKFLLFRLFCTIFFDQLWSIQSISTDRINFRYLHAHLNWKKEEGKKLYKDWRRRRMWADRPHRLSIQKVTKEKEAKKRTHKVNKRQRQIKPTPSRFPYPNNIIYFSTFIDS